mmetsp:Transcript_166322/g.534155  ORF Transcript_166322/g.534155 Transcript_166322/m.534155 type:complete len:250 (+) Transcript_166322:2168-2917(+)
MPVQELEEQAASRPDIGCFAPLTLLDDLWRSTSEVQGYVPVHEESTSRELGHAPEVAYLGLRIRALRGQYDLAQPHVPVYQVAIVEILERHHDPSHDLASRSFVQLLLLGLHAAEQPTSVEPLGHLDEELLGVEDGMLLDKAAMIERRPRQTELGEPTVEKCPQSSTMQNVCAKDMSPAVQGQMHHVARSLLPDPDGDEFLHLGTAVCTQHAPAGLVDFAVRPLALEAREAELLEEPDRQACLFVEQLG